MTFENYSRITNSCAGLPDDFGKDETELEFQDMNFPRILMEMLRNEKLADTITWLKDGQSFVILNHKKLVSRVLPMYFKKHVAYTSFTRRLIRWGFCNVAKGTYKSIHFIRNDPSKCMLMTYNAKRKRGNAKKRFAAEKQVERTTTSATTPSEESVKSAKPSTPIAATTSTNHGGMFHSRHVNPLFLGGIQTPAGSRGVHVSKPVLHAPTLGHTLTTALSLNAPSRLCLEHPPLPYDVTLVAQKIAHAAMAEAAIRREIEHRQALLLRLSAMKTLRRFNPPMPLDGTISMKKRRQSNTAA